MGNYASLNKNSISGFTKIPSINFRYCDWTKPAIIYTGKSINITNLNSNEIAYMYFDGSKYILQEIAIDMALTENTEIHLIHKKDDMTLGATHVIVNVIINNNQNQSFWNILMRHNVPNIPMSIFDSRGSPFRMKHSHIYLNNLASVLSEYKHIEKFYYCDSKYDMNSTLTKTNFVIMKTPFSGLNFVRGIQQRMEYTQ